ncbi:MAG: thiamine-phosphate kinase [Pseudomonadota bacterium]|nr:thiamine-phosphate kinase [Pseudomonadota bacterium]
MALIEGEFGLIDKYFAPLSKNAPGAVNLTDDVAFFEVSPGLVPVVSVDTLVGGVHFFPQDPPGNLAKKLIRVSLSDLAASGARPLGYFLSLSIPADTDESWVAEFARGLCEDQKEFGIALFGGDTTVTSGPLSLSLTAVGEAASDKIVRRSGAKPGQRVFVTGTIGDSALGLTLIKKMGMREANLHSPELVQRYLVPNPRVKLAHILGNRVAASIDISDGLVGDLAHICKASGVSISIDFSMLPLSASAQREIEANPTNKGILLTGGDDYEIILCCSPENSGEIVSKAAEQGVTVTEIGRVTNQGDRPVRVTEGGCLVELEDISWRHF